MLIVRRYLVCAILWMAATMQVSGQEERSLTLEELQTEMYRLFETDDSLDFRDVVIQLKVECEREGNEILFYRAWSHQAMYEVLHNRVAKAIDIAKLIKAFAEDRDSKVGYYASLHVMGAIYNQMHDHQHAEEYYKKAIDYIHQNLPEMSAASNYIELLILCESRGEIDQALAYAHEALDEPNVTAYQRARVLTMLCNMEGERENPHPALFNKYYEERLQTIQGAVPGKADTYINVLHEYVNGMYDQALSLSDSLNILDRTFAKSLIYHKMGDDAKAYQMMLANRAARDSMSHTEISGLFSDYITQLHHERQKLEKHVLMEKNEHLVVAITAIIISIFIAVLCWIIYHRVKLAKKLHSRTIELDKLHSEEREERKKAEKELDMKREFLINIARELRSPLSSTSGLTDMLTEDVPLQAEERELMRQHIKENSMLLHGIIDNMIELTFYESKTSLDKHEKFSPNLVCQHAIDHISQSYKKDDVELSFKTELDPDLLVESDMLAVSKVIHQLLDNAMKFTDHGGVVLYCKQEGDKVQIIVSDSGCGIEPEWRAHIFQPMMVSGSVIRSKGMGLAICSVITRLLNGRLWLDERVKKGSRFVFEIPIHS